MINEKWKNLAFIVPAVAYIVLISFLPTILAVRGGFQTNLSQWTTVNYLQIWQLKAGNAIVNTAVVTGLALLVQFILGFIIATILTKEFFGKRTFSVLYLLPFGVATVVAGFVFSNIFTYTGGYANSMLTLLGIYHLFGITSINWLTAYWNATFSLVISDSWKNTPIVALILLAGMNSISPDIYNQALIDGAGPVSRFFKITLPNLSSYIAIALIIRGISEFNIFAIALLLYRFPLLTVMTYGFFNGGGTYYESYATATILLAFILIFAGIVIFNRSRQYKVQNGLVRKKNWFERFRWFYTSEGFLVVAGKSISNGKRLLRMRARDLAKRKGENPDVYIASESPNVPDAIIEVQSDTGPSEISILEACSFVLSYTSEWSKTDSEMKFHWKHGAEGQSNEIVVKPTELEIGISDVSGESLPMVVPTGTRRAVTGDIVRFRAGAGIPSLATRKKIAGQLDLPLKEIRGMIPEVGIEITEIFKQETAKVLERPVRGGAA